MKHFQNLSTQHAKLYDYNSNTTLVFDTCSENRVPKYQIESLNWIVTHTETVATFNLNFNSA